MIFRLSTRLYSSTLLAPALLWAVSTAAVGGNCMVDSELDTLAPVTSSTLSLARPTAQADAFEARCDAQGLAELVIEIQPGQRFNLELLVQHPRADSALLSEIGKERMAEWLTFEVTPRQHDQFWGYPLQIAALPDFQAGDRLELVLEVDLGAGSFKREIPITLIVQQEAPLFRSRFEVDPVLGQFSYRLPPPRPASDAARAQVLIVAALGD